MSKNSYVLSFSCKSKSNVITRVYDKISKFDGKLIDVQQYDDQNGNMIFARMRFETATDGALIHQMQEELSEIMNPLNAQWRLRCRNYRQRILIMVSQHGHCLDDLLFRSRSGDLKVDIVAIVSNHSPFTHEGLNMEGIPFFHMPITDGNKMEQENNLLALVAELSVDLVVLARYMQVLSDQTTAKLSGRCINIHHSFLPGFKGGKPYHQAYDRGVKLVGATAHYVTGDLDEGPIITQNVETTSHRDTPNSLTRKGRDIERRVLTSAVHHHVDDRVFLNGRTTVVFPE